MVLSTLNVARMRVPPMGALSIRTEPWSQHNFPLIPIVSRIIQKSACSLYNTGAQQWACIDTLCASLFNGQRQFEFNLSIITANYFNLANYWNFEIKFLAKLLDILSGGGVAKSTLVIETR